MGMLQRSQRLAPKSKLQKPVFKVESSQGGGITRRVTVSPPLATQPTPGRDYERVRRFAGYADNHQSASKKTARRYPCGAEQRQTGLDGRS